VALALGGDVAGCLAACVAVIQQVTDRHGQAGAVVGLVAAQQAVGLSSWVGAGLICTVLLELLELIGWKCRVAMIS
jgi:hypothetical protein